MIAACSARLRLSLRLLLCPPAPAQQAVHGADSIFVSPTVKLAWAVRRGATEAETLVVVRVVAGRELSPHPRRRRRSVHQGPQGVRGDAPARSRNRHRHPARAIRRSSEHRVPFLCERRGRRRQQPKAHRVLSRRPDTTPEFAGQREADAYLDRMLSRSKIARGARPLARANGLPAGGKTARLIGEQLLGSAVAFPG